MSFAGKVKAGEAYVKITADNSALIRGMAKAQSNLRSFGQTMKGLGGDMMQLGGVASIPLVMAGKSFADFDDKMRSLQAVSGATDNEMKTLTTYVRKLGATTAFTAQQVGQGAINLARMGFAADEVENGLKPVLNLVRATGTETHRLGEISEYAAATLRQYGLSSESFAKVCDVMAYASNNSSMSIADLGEAMKVAGPSAKAVGEDVKDTASMLMLMANAGVKGSLAGTALRKVYQSLAAQSGKTKGLSKEQIEEGIRGNKQLSEMGIQIVDPKTGNLRKAADIMVDIAKKAKALKSGEKVNFTTDVFDLRGSLAALAMLNNAADMKDFRKRLDESAGYAQKVADKMEAGFGGMIRFLISQFQDMQISIGEAFYETFKPWIQKLPQVTAVIRNLLTANKKLVAYFAVGIVSVFALGAAFFALGIVCKMLAPLIGLVSVAIKALVFVIALPINAVIAVIKVFKLMWMGIKAAVAGIKVAFAALKAAFIAVKATFVGLGLLGTVTHVLLPIIAIVTAVVVAWNSLKAAFSAFGNGLKSLGSSLASAFGNIKKIAGEAFGIVKDALISGDTAGAAKVALAALYNIWVEGITPLKKAWAGLKLYILDTWVGLKANLMDILTPIVNAFDTAFTWIAAAFSKMIVAIKVAWRKFELRRQGASESLADELVRDYERAQYKEIQNRIDASEERKKARTASIDDDAAQGLKNNKSEYDKAVKKADEDLAKARKDYNDAKDFAAQWKTMKDVVKQMEQMFQDAQETYRLEGAPKDAEAKAQMDKFKEMQKSDPSKADDAIREAIKGEKEKARAAKEAFNKALEEAQADRVIDDDEKKKLAGLAAQFGRASELKSQYEALLGQASVETAKGIAGGGGSKGIFGGTDIDALGVEQPVREINTKMDKLGSWLKKVVDNTGGTKYQFT